MSEKAGYDVVVVGGGAAGCVVAARLSEDRRTDRVPGSVYAGHRFIDVFIHGWDLATATRQDPALDPDLMEACRLIIEPQLELFRSAGALAAELPSRQTPPPRPGSWQFSAAADDTEPAIEFVRRLAALRVVLTCWA